MCVVVGWGGIKSMEPYSSQLSSERKKRQQTQTEVQDNLFKHFFCEDSQILNRLPGELHPWRHSSSISLSLEELTALVEPVFSRGLDYIVSKLQLFWHSGWKHLLLPLKKTDVFFSGSFCPAVESQLGRPSCLSLTLSNFVLVGVSLAWHCSFR